MRGASVRDDKYVGVWKVGRSRRRSPPDHLQQRVPVQPDQHQRECEEGQRHHEQHRAERIATAGGEGDRGVDPEPGREVEDEGAACDPGGDQGTEAAQAAGEGGEQDEGGGGDLADADGEADGLRDADGLADALALGLVVAAI